MIPKGKSKFREGDLVPLKTQMGNIVYCELLDAHWKLNPFNEESDTVCLYDCKGLLYLVDQLEFRRKNKFDNIIITSGWERTGKSMLTIVEKRISDSPLYQDKERFTDLLKADNWSIENFMQSPLRLNQVCFDLDDYHTQISACEENKDDFIILDEAGYRLFALEWWASNQINLIKEFQVIGKRRIKTNMNVPHKDDLNNRIRDRRVTFWQYVFVQQRGSNVERGYVEIREANPDKWQLQVYWNPMFVCRFPEIDDDEWKKYEKKKDKFILDVIDAQVQQNAINPVGGKREARHYRDANKLMIAMNEGHNGKDGWTLSDIGKIIGIAGSSVGGRVSKERELTKYDAERDRIAEKKIRENEEIAKALELEESEELQKEKSKLRELEEMKKDLDEMNGDENGS